MQAPAQESVTVYWDFACTVHASAFTSTRISDSVRNLREALFPYGNILCIKAYADFSPSLTPRDTRLGLSSAGVTLVDCPTDQRADLPTRTLMLDALLAACEGKPPHTFVFVTSDAGLAPTLATLRMRKYRVILISPLSTPKDLIEQASLNHDLTRTLLGIGDGIFDSTTSPKPHIPTSSFPRQPPGSAAFNGAFSSTPAATFQVPSLERPLHAASTGPGLYQPAAGFEDWPPRRTSLPDPLTGRSRSNTFGRPPIKEPSPPGSRLSEAVFPLPIASATVEPTNIPAPPLQPLHPLTTSPKPRSPEPTMPASVPPPAPEPPARFSPPRFGPRRASMAASHRSEVVSQYFSGRASPQVIEDNPKDNIQIGTALRSASSAPSTPLPKSASSTFSFIDAATETAPTSAETIKGKGKQPLAEGVSQLPRTSTVVVEEPAAAIDDSFYDTRPLAVPGVFVPPSRRSSLSPPLRANPASPCRSPQPRSRTPTPEPPAPFVPAHFRPLVDTLQGVNNFAVTRSTLGAILLKKYRGVYQNAGVRKLGGYIEAAVEAGIVSESLAGKELMITLRPSYRR